MIECKECGLDCIDEEFLNRHLKHHKITLKDYTLKWIHENVIPKCRCGCGQNTSWNVARKAFTTFVHGHHSYGRIVSLETRQKIGKKNSVNMKRYLKKHPDIAKLKHQQLQTGHTIESQIRRIEATKQAYASMLPKDKVKFSQHAKKQWENGTLAKAHKKSVKTFYQRSKAGEYNFIERNEKLSDSISRLYMEGGFCWAKGTFISKKTNKHHAFRSSFEYARMCQLDDDPEVLTWESEFIRITYSLNGKKKQYIPDLHITYTDGQQVLEEVKPYELRNIPMNIAKRFVAQQFCAKNGWKYVEWDVRD